MSQLHKSIIDVYTYLGDKISICVSNKYDMDRECFCERHNSQFDYDCECTTCWICCSICTCTWPLCVLSGCCVNICKNSCMKKDISVSITEKQIVISEPMEIYYKYTYPTIKNEEIPKNTVLSSFDLKPIDDK